MDPGILLIIAFIVAPLIERLLKAGKQQGQDQQPPQPRAPQPRAEQRKPAERFPRDGWGTSQDADPPVLVSRRNDEDDAAAGMLPDDLWEILTGERRTPREMPPQPPRPVPQPSYEEEDFTLEETHSLEEGGSLEEQSPGEWITTAPEDDVVVLPEKIYTRPNPIRPAPQVVSLELLEYDSEIRHDEFHDRLDSLGGPAKVRRPAFSAYRFRTDEDLRRAIVMAEILGPPKGLEDMP